MSTFVEVAENRPSRRRLSLLSAVFFCASGGAFGIHTYLLRYSDTAAGWYLALVIGLSIVVAAHTLLLRRNALKWPIWTLLLFGLLPFVHFLIVFARSGSQPGIFGYLYIFAPYLTGVYWASQVRKRSLKTLTMSVKVYAAVVSIRQIAVFMFPEKLGLPTPNAVYDATYVYSYVGSLPRVFGPGVMIIALAVLLYLGDWSRRQLTPVGRVGLGVAVLASATTFTRGTNLVLIAMAIMSILLPVKSRQRRRVPQVLKTIVGYACLAGTVVIMVSANSGYLQELLPGAGDRVTLDTATFDWRSAQVARAFTQSDAWWQNWLFGVGPAVFIQNDTNDVHSTVNELHYSYASVLWTFGALGLALLLGSLFGLAIYGWNVALGSPAGLEWYLGAWMFMIVGVYTPTFTETSSALGLTVCAAAIVGSIGSVRGGTDRRALGRSLKRIGIHQHVIAEVDQ